MTEHGGCAKNVAFHRVTSAVYKTRTKRDHDQESIGADCATNAAIVHKRQAFGCARILCSQSNGVVDFLRTVRIDIIEFWDPKERLTLYVGERLEC